MTAAGDDGIYYPPGAFYFSVAILGTPTTPWTESVLDGSFREISGLDRELEFEEVREGGENRFAHRLPKRGKHPNLVLKRGLVPTNSRLAQWADETLGSTLATPIQPVTVQVMLLTPDNNGEQKPPLLTWSFYQAYPVKWSIAPFNATDGAIAVETLEIAYTYLELKPTPQAGPGKSRGIPPPPPPPPVRRR